jgi:hypothetical protein
MRLHEIVDVRTQNGNFAPILSSTQNFTYMKIRISGIYMKSGEAA